MTAQDAIRLESKVAAAMLARVVAAWSAYKDADKARPDIDAVIRSVSCAHCRADAEAATKRATAALNAYLRASTALRIVTEANAAATGARMCA